MCYSRPMRPAPKSAPFSIRLSKPTELFVSAEARRTRRSKGAVVEALTEEAARMRRFPGIGFRDDDANRRAWVVGTGLDVWEIVEMLEQYGSAQSMLEDHQQLLPRAVDLARAYYSSYPDEIDERIADNRRPLADLRELYPLAELKIADSRR